MYIYICMHTYIHIYIYVYFPNRRWNFGGRDRQCRTPGWHKVKHTKSVITHVDTVYDTYVYLYLYAHIHTYIYLCIFPKPALEFWWEIVSVGLRAGTKNKKQRRYVIMNVDTVYTTN